MTGMEERRGKQKEYKKKTLYLVTWYKCRLEVVNYRYLTVAV